MCFCLISLTHSWLDNGSSNAINEEALCFDTCALELSGFESGMQPLGQQLAVQYTHSWASGNAECTQTQSLYQAATYPNWLGRGLHHQKQVQTKEKAQQPYHDRNRSINCWLSFVCVGPVFTRPTSGPNCCHWPIRAAHSGQSKMPACGPNWPDSWKSPSGQRTSGQCHALYCLAPRPSSLPDLHSALPELKRKLIKKNLHVISDFCVFRRLMNCKMLADLCICFHRSPTKMCPDLVSFACWSVPKFWAFVSKCARLGR